MDPRSHMVSDTRLTWAHWAQALDGRSKDIQDGLGPHKRLGLATDEESLVPRPGPTGELFFLALRTLFLEFNK